MAFDKFLKKNLDLKILSLTLSALLWLFVHLTQSVEGIGRSETHLKAPLIVENLAPNLDVLSASSAVSISISGIHKSLEGVKSSDFKAYVDMDGKGPGAFRNLPVRISSPVGY